MSKDVNILYGVRISITIAALPNMVWREMRLSAWVYYTKTALLHGVLLSATILSRIFRGAIPSPLQLNASPFRQMQ